MKLKKILGILIKRILSFFRVSNKERCVEQSHVEIKKARVAETIFDDSKLKTNEKLYLIILIRAFNTGLGYAEISNKEIMKAASCSNNNTLIGVINRLEKNGYIKRFEKQRGKIGKYSILRHIEFSDESVYNIFSNKVCNDDFNSIKATDSDQIERCDKAIVISKEKVHENDANGFLKKIQNDIRTSSEILGKLINKNTNIDEEIDIFFKEK